MALYGFFGWRGFFRGMVGIFAAGFFGAGFLVIVSIPCGQKVPLCTITALRSIPNAERD